MKPVMEDVEETSPAATSSTSTSPEAPRRSRGRRLTVATRRIFGARRSTAHRSTPELSLDRMNPLDRALLNASEEGDSQEVVRLCAHGADVHAGAGGREATAGTECKTALMIATEQNHTVTALLLLRHGASESSRDTSGKPAGALVLSVAHSDVPSACRATPVPTQCCVTW